MMAQFLRVCKPEICCLVRSYGTHRLVILIWMSNFYCNKPVLFSFFLYIFCFFFFSYFSLMYDENIYFTHHTHIFTNTHTYVFCIKNIHCTAKGEISNTFNVTCNFFLRYQPSDHYETLNVSPNASQKEIRRAFIKLSKQVCYK